MSFWLSFVGVLACVPVATALQSTTTANAPSASGGQQAKNTVPTDGESPSSPSSSPSSFSLSPSASFDLSSLSSMHCAGKLLNSEARAGRLEQELVQKTRELGLKIKELELNGLKLDQERQQSQAAEQLLRRFKEGVNITSLKEESDSAGYLTMPTAEWLSVVGEKSSGRDGGSRRDNDRVDDTTSRILTTMEVSTERELTSALGNMMAIEFSANIVLTSTVHVVGLISLSIDGKGFKLDGQNSVSSCLYIRKYAELALTNLIITRGYAITNGGGLLIISSTVTMNSCSIFENNAGRDGGGLDISGSSVVTMFSCAINENIADNDGGGLEIDDSSVTMGSCSVVSNRASLGSGGGLRVSNSAVVAMTSSTIAVNAASVKGGGVYIPSGVLDLIGCTFSLGNGQQSQNLAGGQIDDINTYFGNEEGNTALNLYSHCPGHTAHIGTGSLACHGCSGSVGGYLLESALDLSDTSSCTACESPHSFACCGARQCSEQTVSCSDTALGICAAPPMLLTMHPTLLPAPFPTSSPMLLPTIHPTLLPAPFPTSSPTPLPTIRSTLLPAPFPTSSPTPLPTIHPTLLPAPFPTSSPSPLPTLSPTVYCGRGSFFNEAVDICALCPVGKFTNTSVAPFPRNCEMCVAGTYAKEQGMAVCESCPQGKLSSSDRSFCQDCSAGEYSKDAKECAVCEIGRYAPQPLTGSCIVCGAGLFTNTDTAATTCSLCNAGYFSTERTAVACNLCAVGSASVSGQASCTLCEAGKYAGFQGSSICTACAAGFSVGTEGASSCNECTPGKFQSRASESSCKLCAGGKFSSESASTACSECPRGYSSAGGSSSCDGKADEDYFLFQGLATYCPKHSVCDGGTVMPRPNTGYWVDRDSLEHVHEIYKCPTLTCLRESQTTTNPRQLAKGGDDRSCWNIAAYSDGSNDGSLCNSDNLLCKRGSRGALCGSCDNAFIFSSAQRVCIACSERGLVALYITGTVILLGGLFTVSQYMQVIPLCVERSWMWGLLRQVDSGDVRVAWANYQIIQSASWNVDFPSPFKELISALSIVSFDFLSLECLFENSDHFLSVYVWSVAPIMLAASLLLVRVVRNALSQKGDHKVGAASLKSTTLTYQLLLLCYLVLPPVTLKQFQAIDCVAVAGRSYLRVDTSVDCDSRQFQSFRIVVGLFLALYLATPLVWFFLLYRERNKLNPPISACGTDNIDYIIAVRDGDASLQPLRFLFSSYQPTFYYIECLEMYRRVLFVGVLPLLSAKSDRRSALGVFLSLCSLAFYNEVAPFLRPSTNILAYVAQYANLLTFGAALAVEVGLDKGLNSFVFGCTLIAVNIVVVGLIFRASVLNYLRERNLQQWRRTLTPQELLIVNRVMRGLKGFLMQGSSTLDEVELAERGGESHKYADIETRSMKALQQSLIDSKHVKMTDRVGTGGFGEVFKGTMMGQPVAVKTLIRITDDSVKAFRNEILLSGTLRHPNIVLFVGSCWGEDLMCLVLEWVPRGTLSALLENKTQDLSWGDPLLRIAMDIARGMAYLHGREYFDDQDGVYKRCILHRDLKPDNALVTDYMSIKIADFGCARVKAADDVLMTGVGTPLYCAPEVSRGDAYDEKADAYSFGMTLIDMASDESIANFISERWQRAFSQNFTPNPQKISFNKVLRPIWEGKWHPVSEGHPIEYAPTSINKLIVRCCSHDLEIRPSFTEILNELSGPCSVEIGESAIFYRNAGRGPPRGSGESWVPTLPEKLLVVSGKESTTTMSSVSDNNEKHNDALKRVEESQCITGETTGPQRTRKRLGKDTNSLNLEELPEPGSQTTSMHVRPRCVSVDLDCHAALSNLPGAPLGTALV